MPSVAQLTLVLIAVFRDGTAFGASAQRFESWLRWLLIVAVPLSVAYSTVTGRLALAPYVGAKLLLFALVLFFGHLLSARLEPLRLALAELGTADLATHGPSTARDQAMRVSLARSRPYSVAIWLALLTAALMGVLKPGVPRGLPDGDRALVSSVVENN